MNSLTTVSFLSNCRLCHCVSECNTAPLAPHIAVSLWRRTSHCAFGAAHSGEPLAHRGQFFKFFRSCASKVFLFAKIFYLQATIQLDMCVTRWMKPDGRAGFLYTLT